MGEEDVAAGEDVAPEAAVEDEDEPHAAVTRPKLTARPDRAIRRYFTIFSSMVFGFLIRFSLTTGRCHPVDAARVT
jgi:hypothetical protein